jgi:hypothetical protein
MSKVGRNEPCPCGSGRKHKHSCLAAETGPTDLLWHRLRSVIEPLVADLLTFSRGEFGEALIEEAWDEFSLGEDPPPFSPDTVHMPVFIPWFLYECLADPAATAVPADLLDQFPIAAGFLRRARRIDPLLAQYIRACLERPFSFLEVVAAAPGTGFRLHDDESDREDEEPSPTREVDQDGRQVHPQQAPTAGGPAEILGIFDRDARRGHQGRDEPSAGDHPTRCPGRPRRS